MQKMTVAHEVNALDSVEYWQGLYRKSLLRFFLLAELAKKPMHGYEAATAVAVCCDWPRPADAMIYPMLRELEEGGYIECQEALDGRRRRNVCRLTDRGQAAYRAAAQAWAFALPQLERAVKATGVEPGCCALPNVRMEMGEKETGAKGGTR
jgi:DNA-binding PadR family transcriptional regulator